MSDFTHRVVGHTWIMRGRYLVPVDHEVMWRGTDDDLVLQRQRDPWLSLWDGKSGIISRYSSPTHHHQLEMQRLVTKPNGTTEWIRYDGTAAPVAADTEMVNAA